MKSLPNFTQCSIKELTLLLEMGLSGQQVIVYNALCAFDFRKIGNAFPSISTIRELLNWKISKRSVYKALAKLEELGMIKRGKTHNSKGKVNKRRFMLLQRCAKDFVRRVSESASKLFPSTGDLEARKNMESTTKGAEMDTIIEKEKREPFLQQNKRRFKPFWNRGRYISVKMQKEERLQQEERLKREQTYQNSGDFAIARLIAGVPISELTEHQRLAIKREEYDKDWLDEYHPKLKQNLQSTC